MFFHQKLTTASTFSNDVLVRLLVPLVEVIWFFTPARRMQYRNPPATLRRHSKLTLDQH
jgi:hypothetical protein